MDLVWADPAANRARAEEALEEIFSSCPDGSGPDLAVLPEMFSTGFATLPEGIAEKCPSTTLEWMKDAAARFGCALAGSIAMQEGERFVNRFCFVKPDGQVTTYDKKHLFTFGGEHHRFAAGTERVTVQWREVRFLPIICYDLRFPVWSRCRGDYDAIICVASWPQVRRTAWDTLLRARAIENQCYVLAVNRTGDDPSCHYNGGSAVIGPLGQTLAACPDGRHGWTVCELDMEQLGSFRKSFPALEDADQFTLE